MHPLRTWLGLALCVVMVAGLGIATTGVASAGTMGYSPIRNASGDRRCLDVRAEDDYNRNGARIQLWRCSGAAEQQWRLVYVGDIYGGNTYQIKAKRSGKCLVPGDTDAATGQPSNVATGLQIIQYNNWVPAPGEPCTTDRYARALNWTLKPTNEITWTLSDGSERCLDTTGSPWGSMVMLWECNGTLKQRWIW